LECITDHGKSKVIPASVWKAFEVFHSPSSLRIMGLNVNIWPHKSQECYPCHCSVQCIWNKNLEDKLPVGMKLLQIMQKLTGLADHTTNFHFHSSVSESSGVRLWHVTTIWDLRFSSSSPWPWM